MPTYAWVSPTGNAADGTWLNPANVYDGNWATVAENGSFPTGESDGSWTTWLTLTFAGLMWMDRVRFEYFSYMLHIQILNNTTGNWDLIWKGEKKSQVTTVAFPSTYSDRIRIRGNEQDKHLYVNEVEVEEVTPDAPAPPAPDPPDPVETHTVTQKTIEGSIIATECSRFRSFHRRSELKPVVVG